MSGHRTKAWLASVALASIALTSCGVGQDAGQRDATVAGKVLLSPTCPVEVQGSPCPRTPAVGATVEVLQRDEVVGSDTADSAGQFSVAVPSGSSLVRATATEGLPSEDSLTVTVTSGETTTVELTLDTGIR